MKNYLDWLLRQGQEDFWLEQDDLSAQTAADFSAESAQSPLPGERETEAAALSRWEGAFWEDETAENALPSLSLRDGTGALLRRGTQTLESDSTSLLEQETGNAALGSRSAALTAAALDKLVQRDARRYDQGFSLR